jgi:hypothetical protein
MQAFLKYHGGKLVIYDLPKKEHMAPVAQIVCYIFSPWSLSQGAKRGASHCSYSTVLSVTLRVQVWVARCQLQISPY